MLLDQAPATTSPPQRRAASPRPHATRRLARAIVAALGLALLHTTLSPAPAIAQDSRVQDLVGRARTARDDGRFDDAIRFLLQAFDLRPDPALLFNVAKVYEAQNDCENVLRYFMRAADANALGKIERPEVDKAIRTELRAFACVDNRALTVRLLEQAFVNFPEPAILLNLGDNYRALGQCEKAETAYKQTAERTPPRGPLHNDAQIALAELDCQPIEPLPLIEPPSTHNWLAYGLTGAGTLAFVGGLVLETVWLLDYTTYQDKLDAAASPGLSDDARTRLEGEASELFQAIEDGRKISVPLLVVGVLLGATGATFWALDIGQPAAPDATSLRPVLTPDTAGVSLAIPLP